jgi:hypothetical protein
MVDTADGAQLDGAFFLVTRVRQASGRVDTVLTLRAADVVGAEVLQDGVRIDYVSGKGEAQK